MEKLIKKTRCKRFRLDRRPGRHPLHDQGSPELCPRAGKLGNAFLQNQRWPHLSESFWGTNPELWRWRTGAPNMRSSRFHRPLHVAHSVRSGVSSQCRFFHRIFRSGSVDGEQRVSRSDRVESGGRLPAQVLGKKHRHIHRGI